MSPERGQSGQTMLTARASLGTSMRSIFSIIFTRDCTCAACEARALKRAMNSSSLASLSSWRLAAASRLLRRCSDSLT
ncbi:hypothetical protein D3C78_1598050 [compost metagenome]